MVHIIQWGNFVIPQRPFGCIQVLGQDLTPKPPYIDQQAPKPYQTVANESVNMDGACWIINQGMLCMVEHMCEWESLQDTISSQEDHKATIFTHYRPQSNIFPDLSNNEWCVINEGAWVVSIIKLEHLNYQDDQSGSPQL